MESPRNPRQSGRRTCPSRPRSRIYRKKNIVKRVTSTLRRRRSQLHCMYQNALIEMAESKLNLPHEGQSGLIYAVPKIPTGHSRQSLIDVFDDVVATMSATTTKPSSQRSWQTVASSGNPVDLLTGDCYDPEDFDHYLVWQPLKSLPAQPVLPANAKPQEPIELTWSPPRSPPKHSNESLIDLNPSTTGPPTPKDVQSSTIDELFFGGLSDALTSTPLIPSQSEISLDATLWPQPLKFNDSPFPVLESHKPTPSTPRRPIRKRATHGNIRLDTQHPALQISLASPRASPIESLRSAQSGRLVPRKPVSETPIRQLQPADLWQTPTSPYPYRPYRLEIPSPSLPPVFIRATDSLLDEMNDELDKVMLSFSPPPGPSFPATPTPALSSFPQPSIPPRTTSRAAPTSNLPIPHPHASTSFRSRLGANTLAALLAASEEAQPSPILGESYSWHRWVDRTRDEDSETEEQQHQRRWREKRREERKRV